MQSQTSKQPPSRVLGILGVVCLYLRGPHRCLRGLVSVLADEITDKPVELVIREN